MSKKVELKWDFKTEEKLFKIFKKMNYSKLNRKTLKIHFDDILKTFSIVKLKILMLKSI